MLPDLSEYNWVIPDFIWELSEQIDLGKFSLSTVKLVIKLFNWCVIIYFWIFAEKITKALPEMEDIAKLLPDFEKIGENFAFLKSLLPSGE